MTLKRMMQEKAEKGEVSDGEESDPEKLPDVKLQAKLKGDFLAAAEGSDDEFLMQKKKAEVAETAPAKDEMEVLKSFWGEEDKEMNKDDKFLRDYIMGKRWKEMGDEIAAEVDREDEERDSEIDKFEKQYNFRFEEAGGAQI